MENAFPLAQAPAVCYNIPNFRNGGLSYNGCYLFRQIAFCILCH